MNSNLHINHQLLREQKKKNEQWRCSPFLKENEENLLKRIGGISSIFFFLLDISLIDLVISPAAKVVEVARVSGGGR